VIDKAENVLSKFDRDDKYPCIYNFLDLSKYEVIMHCSGFSKQTWIFFYQDPDGGI
jgi:hypothetical protein